jgi:ferritin-like metal-binding protein YciE
MASIPNLHALLIDELGDLLFAEKQLVKALPKMAKAASNADLKAGFTGHLAQTRIHVERLMEALGILGSPVSDKTCQAMLGLVAEGGEAIETDGPAAVRDANLITARPEPLQRRWEKTRWPIFFRKRSMRRVTPTRS